MDKSVIARFMSSDVKIFATSTPNFSVKFSIFLPAVTFEYRDVRQRSAKILEFIVFYFVEGF